MGRFTRLWKVAPVALAGLLGLTPSHPAFAAEPNDNDEVVAGSEFEGFPDKDTHSGVFCDIIATGSSSLVQPAQYRIIVPAATPTLRVAIFDANSAGMWDQNARTNDGVNVAPDGSVVGYDLAAEGPGAPAFPLTPSPFAIGDSQTATPRLGAKVFSNAVDGRWEFLYEGPHDPAATLINGDHQYLLTVQYLVPQSSAINGFKVAANGFVGQAPRGNQVLIGGFIGGVVDSRNLAFNQDGQAIERSTSRDHYPDLVKNRVNLSAYNATLTDAPTHLPVTRFGGSADPFVNRYDGTFDVRIRLTPPPGTTWAQYLENLILEEGDADDIDDVSGVGPDGLPSPSNIGMPPDDGGPYTDGGGVTHDNRDYALPFNPASPTYPGRLAGSAYLELIDPTGAVRVTLTDLSGNVSTDDGTFAAFERIPVPLDGIAGDWTVRMHQLDARNSWFLRSNATFVPLTQRLCGRVYHDTQCDGVNDVVTDPGLSPVDVKITRTDADAPVLTVTTAADGTWCVDPIAPGTYSVSVPAGQTAIGDRTEKTPQPISRTVTAGVAVTDADLGYCDKSCDCDADRRIHQVTFEGSVWMADPYAKSLWVYVRLDRANDRCCQGDIQDLVDFTYTGAFPGAKTGANGILEVTDVRVVDGYAKVTVVVTADAPQLPSGFFDGSFRIETTVNGVGEAACGKITCDTIKVGDVFPKGWKPLWCGDVPDFKVVNKVAFSCWSDKPCTGGCVRGKTWWKQVNKNGACAATKISWPAPANEDTSKICGKTWLWVLNQNATCDTWTALAQQLITAKLNGYAGACLPKSVQTAIEQATALLEAACETRRLTGLCEERGWRLARILEAYNLGLIGPKKCSGDVPCCPPPPPPPCKPTPPPCKPTPPKCEEPPKCDDRKDDKKCDDGKKDDKSKCDDRKDDKKCDDGKKDDKSKCDDRKDDKKCDDGKKDDKSKCDDGKGRK